MNRTIMAMLSLLGAACVQAATPLPVDPEIRKGSLSNGLTYYLRSNQKPENRLELRLVVHAGSLQEDDDQQGLAHFLEHMAFNGTTHFKRQEMVSFIESIGMRFGAHLNAYTSFDATVYQLRVPTQQEEIVKKGFLVLADWAAGMTLDELEVDQERDVIIEEWRSRRGAGKRMQEKQLPVLFHGSKYADRLPIGKKEIITSFDYQTLRRFYRDWYRPDLMAVVAVGDAGLDELEALVRHHFEPLKNPDTPRPKECEEVPGHPETLFAPASDPEANRSTAQIVYKLPAHADVTEEDYRTSMVEGYYQQILNRRLQELSRAARPPFLSASVGKDGYVRTLDVFTQFCMAKDGELAAALETVLLETERVRRFGVTATELERAKRAKLRAMEQLLKEKENTESSSYANEYVRNFIRSEPIPGIVREVEYYQRFSPGITREAVSTIARTWMTSSNRVVLVNTPEKEGALPPSNDALAMMLQQVPAAPLEPWVDASLEQELIPSPPAPGKVVAQQVYPGLDLVVWELSNRARVLLKPTDFKNDEILFSAFSPGGHSLVEDQDHMSARMADGLITRSGVGDFNYDQLRKKLAGQLVRVTPYIGEMEEGLNGNASPQDLETLFQLAHLYFVSTRKDEDAFLSLKSKLKGLIENRKAQPAMVFHDEINKALSRDHFRRRPLELPLLEEMDYQASHRVYGERFAGAGGFTFVLVGSFDTNAVRPMIETYLAGLPEGTPGETFRDVGVRTPGESLEVEVKKGLEPRGEVRLVFFGEAEWSNQAGYELQSTLALLNIKLRESLREKLGGVYSVYAGGSLNRDPYGHYQVTIGFSCDPAEGDLLKNAVLEQIKLLQNQGPEETDLQKVKIAQLKRRETNWKRNEFWLGVLAFCFRHDLDPNIILDYENRVAGLSSSAIQQCARKFLDPSRMLSAKLLPEKDFPVPESAEPSAP